MATASSSKSLYAPSGSTAWTLKAEWTQGSQDVSNNRTSITVKASLKSSQGSFSGGGGTLYIDWYDNNSGWQTGKASKSTTSISAGGSISCSKTFNVTHKADGTLSGYARARWSKNSNNWVPASGSVSTSNKALTAIPRASVPTMGASSYNINTSFRCNTNRKVSTYVHSVTLQVYNGSTLLGTYSNIGGAKAVGAYVDMSFTAAQIAALMNAAKTVKSFTGKVTVSTYTSSSASSAIGTNTVNFTINVPTTYAPILGTGSDYTITENNSNISSYLSDPGDIVKKLSSKTISVVVTAQNANISSVKISNGSQTVTMSNGGSGSTYSATINNLTAVGFVVTAVDSRGFSKSATYSANGTLYDYVYPALTNIKVQREGTEGSKSSTATLEVSGTWFNGSIGNIQNQLYLQYSFDGGAYDYVVPSSSINASSFTVKRDENNPISSTALYTNNYPVKVKVWDIFGNTQTEIETSLPSSIPVLWMGQKTIRVGGAAIMNYLGLPYSSYISPDGTSVGAGEHLINGDQFTRILKNNGLLNNTGVISTDGGTITVPSSDGVYILFLSGTNDYTVSNKIYMVIPSQSYTICMGEQYQVYSVAQSLTWASGFSAYDSHGSFSRRNGIAGFHLVAKNANNIAYSNEPGAHVCTLNVGLRPRHLIHQIQQGSSNWIFFEMLNENGEIYISRYRNGGANQVLNAGTWINLDIPAYVADDDVGLTISITGTVINIKPKFASLRYHLIRIY